MSLIAAIIYGAALAAAVDDPADAAGGTAHAHVELDNIDLSKVSGDAQDRLALAYSRQMADMCQLGASAAMTAPPVQPDMTNETVDAQGTIRANAISCTAGGSQCVTLVPRNGQPNSGLLQVLYRQQWGTVCDDDFDDVDASVVCRQLGYRHGIRTSSGSDWTRGPIWLDNVRCRGWESSIFGCAHNGWGTHNCQHHEDVNIECFSESWVRYGGYIPAGNDIVVERMSSLSQAKQRCAGLSSCQGFTFQGTLPATVWFKRAWSFSSHGSWTSYRKETGGSTGGGSHGGNGGGSHGGGSHGASACSAHRGCAGLAGYCCPTAHGAYLGCCNNRRLSEDSSSSSSPSPAPEEGEGPAASPIRVRARDSRTLMIESLITLPAMSDVDQLNNCLANSSARFAAATSEVLGESNPAVMGSVSVKVATAWAGASDEAAAADVDANNPSEQNSASSTEEPIFFP